MNFRLYSVGLYLSLFLRIKNIDEIHLSQIYSISRRYSSINLLLIRRKVQC